MHALSGRCRARIGVVAILAVGAAVACGESPQPVDADSRSGAGSTPVAGGDLRIAVLSDPDSWNPYTTRDATTAAILESLYPRLVREVPGAPGESFEPWLAESWERSKDGRTVTFRLRSDASWSDGTPVTCDDVRFTHAVQTDPDLGWQGRAYKERIESVTCLDPRTAAYRFVEAYPDQILDANDNAIVPRSFAEVPVVDWRATVWEDRAVTCGPFRLASVVPGQEVVLERDPRWWGADRVLPERIILRVHPDAPSAVQRLLDGDVDVLRRVPTAQVEAIERHPGRSIEYGPSMSYAFLVWNTLEPGAYIQDRRRRGCSEDPACEETADDILRLRRDRPHPVLADAAVRRALDHAIDRRDLIDGLQGGHARELHTPIVRSLWAHRDVDGRPFDVDRARTGLETAGWIDGDGDGVRERDGVPLRLRIAALAGNPTWLDAAARIAASLRAVGVDATVEPLARGDFVSRIWDKDFDAAISAWRSGTRVEPDLLFHTRAACDRGNNVGSWSTPDSDALLESGAAATTRQEAASIWSRWQERFHEEAPYSILFEVEERVGLSGRVRGATPTALNPFHDLHRWWLASPEAERP